jgi:tripartite-type tricarboxylate transporter receptor subunit TctC
MKLCARKVSSLVVAICLWAPVAVLAQAYPAKSIRLIVPHAPGTSQDLFARLTAPKVGEALGQPIVVDNRPGASGIPGAEAVARAAPDGYTLIHTASGQLISVALLNKNAPFDPIKDFTSIGPAVGPAQFTVVSSSTGVNSLKELIDYARRNPGKLTYGSNGVGNYWHLVGESIKIAGGIDILHVPFKSTIIALQEAQAGRLDVTFGVLSSIRPFIASGKVKVLAVDGAVRFAGMPDVPTLNEIMPNYETVPSWFSFWGPAGLPHPVVIRLNTEINKSIKAPEVIAWFEQNGFVTVAATPEQVSSMHSSGFAVYRKIVNAVGIKPE